MVQVAIVIADWASLTRAGLVKIRSLEATWAGVRHSTPTAPDFYELHKTRRIKCAHDIRDPETYSRQ